MSSENLTVKDSGSLIQAESTDIPVSTVLTQPPSWYTSNSTTNIVQGHIAFCSTTTITLLELKTRKIVATITPSDSEAKQSKVTQEVTASSMLNSARLLSSNITCVELSATRQDFIIYSGHADGTIRRYVVSKLRNEKDEIGDIIFSLKIKNDGNLAIRSIVSLDRTSEDSEQTILIGLKNGDLYMITLANNYSVRQTQSQESNRNVIDVTALGPICLHKTQSNAKSVPDSITTIVVDRSNSESESDSAAQLHSQTPSLIAIGYESGRIILTNKNNLSKSIAIGTLESKKTDLNGAIKSLQVMQCQPYCPESYFYLMASAGNTVTVVSITNIIINESLQLQENSNVTNLSLDQNESRASNATIRFKYEVIHKYTSRDHWPWSSVAILQSRSNSQSQTQIQNQDNITSESDENSLILFLFTSAIGEIYCFAPGSQAKHEALKLSTGLLAPCFCLRQFYGKSSFGYGWYIFQSSLKRHVSSTFLDLKQLKIYLRKTNSNSKSDKQQFYQRRSTASKEFPMRLEWRLGCIAGPIQFMERNHNSAAVYSSDGCVRIFDMFNLDHKHHIQEVSLKYEDCMSIGVSQSQNPKSEQQQNQNMSRNNQVLTALCGTKQMKMKTGSITNVTSTSQVVEDDVDEFWAFGTQSGEIGLIRRPVKGAAHAIYLGPSETSKTNFQKLHTDKIVSIACYYSKGSGTTLSNGATSKSGSLSSSSKQNPKSHQHNSKMKLDLNHDFCLVSVDQNGVIVLTRVLSDGSITQKVVLEDIKEKGSIVNVLNSNDGRSVYFVVFLQIQKRISLFRSSIDVDSGPESETAGSDSSDQDLNLTRILDSQITNLQPKWISSARMIKVKYGAKSSRDLIVLGTSCGQLLFVDAETLRVIKQQRNLPSQQCQSATQQVQQPQNLQVSTKPHSGPITRIDMSETGYLATAGPEIKVSEISLSGSESASGNQKSHNDATNKSEPNDNCLMLTVSLENKSTYNHQTSQSQQQRKKDSNMCMWDSLDRNCLFVGGSQNGLLSKWNTERDHGVTVATNKTAAAGDIKPNKNQLSIKFVQVTMPLKNVSKENLSDHNRNSDVTVVETPTMTQNEYETTIPTTPQIKFRSPESFLNSEPRTSQKVSKSEKNDPIAAMIGCPPWKGDKLNSSDAQSSRKSSKQILIESDSPDFQSQSTSESIPLELKTTLPWSYKMFSQLTESDSDDNNVKLNDQNDTLVQEVTYFRSLLKSNFYDSAVEWIEKEIESETRWHERYLLLYLLSWDMPRIETLERTTTLSSGHNISDYERIYWWVVRKETKNLEANYYVDKFDPSMLLPPLVNPMDKAILAVATGHNSAAIEILEDAELVLEAILVRRLLVDGE